MKRKGREVDHLSDQLVWASTEISECGSQVILDLRPASNYVCFTSIKHGRIMNEVWKRRDTWYLLNEMYFIVIRLK